MANGQRTAGAIQGATAGAAAGPVGAAVGGAAGYLFGAINGGGLFGGKKKKKAPQPPPRSFWQRDGVWIGVAAVATLVIAGSAVLVLRRK